MIIKSYVYISLSLFLSYILFAVRWKVSRLYYVLCGTEDTIQYTLHECAEPCVWKLVHSIQNLLTKSIAAVECEEEEERRDGSELVL